MADYIDDDGNPAKGRRHSVVEINQGKAFLLKITSKRKKLHQVRIGISKCLDVFSFANLNRKLFFNISSLENSNYKYFYICPFHAEDCLNKDLFNIVKKKLQKFWANKFNRDKKETCLDSKLKVPKKLPQKWRKFYPDFKPSALNN